MQFFAGFTQSFARPRHGWAAEAATLCVFQKNEIGFAAENAGKTSGPSPVMPDAKSGWYGACN
ncbi:MAG TPA: hypothetical protein DDX19_16725 [Rhodopirellula baltica]|uniref:Uncharacterized protein n=1 Tax=Rhodopirellula baltica (strain DSM 10527 / NCIMB 13988 / SH1) TaxID=243090 RepID=Q7UF61_RHOBA|nr:hypothetical protein RB10324 [Rhodopirellula baltica SH 1]HBE64346.1 hypothetical protein [Rhodopirellula baltica]